MKRIITAFKEHKEFQKNRPWDVNDMFFPTDIVTPPHYADTIKILLCRNIKGTAFIGGNRFDVSGEKVFFIAPNVIHSMQYQKSGRFAYENAVQRRYRDLRQRGQTG